MAPITKAIRKALDARIDVIMTMYTANIQVKQSIILDACWSPEEQELVNRVYPLVGVNCRGKFRKTHYANFVPDEDLPFPTEERVQSYLMDVPVVIAGTYSGLVPPPDRLDVSRSPELKAASDFVVRRGYERWLIHDRLPAIIGMMPSLEALRYVFPPVVMMLRMSGRSDDANSVESVKRKPVSMPSLPPFDLQTLRYLNTWFAQQVLLGTFEGNHDPSLVDGDVSVSMSATMERRVFNSDQMAWGSVGVY